MSHAWICILTALVTRDLLGGTVHLSPEFVHVVENNSVGLNCSLNGPTSSMVQWTKHDATDTNAFTTVQNSECVGTGFLATFLYEVRCQNDWAFVKIKQVYRNQSGHFWQCSIGGGNNNKEKSNNVHLYVIVPVASVQMTPNAEWVEENAITEFTCGTSTSRPTPFVFWFLVSHDQMTSINISNASSQLPPAGHTENLTEVRSALSYSFNRIYGGWNIYCLASNTPDENVTSAQKQLIIFFPPEGPPSITGLKNGSTYRIVETEHVQLSCIVTGGNPSPNITWSCLNGNVSRGKKNKETVISNITWEAHRGQNNTSCVCTTNHIFGTAHVFVVIEVLYPPDRPKIKKDMKMVTNVIQIIQNNSLTLTCESNSNPSPEYIWINETTGPILNITSFQKQNTGRYICQVNNTMTSSDGETHSGHNNTSITAQLLFPPTLPSFLFNDTNTSTFISGYTISVIKGDRFRLFCQSTGSPSPAYRWEDNTTVSYSVVEARVSVNKTCNATNLMNETEGESRPGTASAGLFIEVLYPPDTPVFKIGNTTVGKQISIIQNNSKSVTCMTDSKPESNYIWVGNSISAETTQTLNITSDTAEYTCMVNNTMVRSYGLKKNGSNSSSVTVQTLFPATLPTFTYLDHSTNKSISGHSLDVIKGDNFTIVCHSAGNPNPDYSWEDRTSGNSTVISALLSVNKTCTATNTMIETVGESRVGNKSAVLSISVYYPPIMLKIRMQHSKGHNMTLEQTFKVLEGDSFSFSCESDGRPTPKYIWYLNDYMSSEKHTIEKVNISRQESGTYTCHAFNTMIRTFGTNENGSRNITKYVDVLFPPKFPTFTYIGYNTNKSISGHSIDVIKGDDFKIVCHSSGNPYPDYSWEDGTGGNFAVISASLSVNKTCIVTNTMIETVGESRVGNKSAVLSILVQYKPIMLRIYLHHSTGYNMTVATTLKVLEGSSFSLTCESDGRPTPDYTWYLNNSVSSVKYRIVKMNISRQESGTYTCNAFNAMIRTFGNNETGSRNISTEVDILYPAEVDILDDLIVIEGNSINITCPVILGNPPSTSVKWIPGGDLRDRDSRILYIANVSRMDGGIYNCSVNTTMEPSHDVRIWKENSVHFQLSVVYKATVMQFFVEELAVQNIIVNETDNVTFWCNIDGKPSPNVNLSHNDNIIYVSESKYLAFTKRNMQCNDFGTYMCSGINDYNNGTPSNKTLKIYVNCSPRPSPDIELTEEVKNARYTQATFSFTALAYPQPGPTGFTWYFMNNSGEVPLSNSSNVVISSSTQFSNLTVLNVTEFEYGEYLLQITNTIGVFKQRYSLLPHVPEQTSEFTKTDTNMTGLIAGIICGLVIVIVASVLAGIRMYRKRNDNDDGRLLYQNVPFSGRHLQNMNKPKKINVIIKETSVDNLQEVDDAPDITNEQPEYCNSTDIIEKIYEVKVSDLFSYVLGKDEESFNMDFQKFPTGLAMPCTFARKPENIALNRYNGIYPYDHSRVKVHGDPDFFINACYIDGYKRTSAYIASLGPTAVTTSDFKTFWQMVWHEKSDIIVMLTNLREPSGMKCERYWPEIGAEELYGDVCVSSKNVEEFAEYTIKTFTLRKDGERRSLTHLHYTAWPDKKVPEDSTSLLEFRQRIKATATSSDGPIVVHCSAGIGRTGTLIAIDRLIEEGHNEGSVDVFECISKMREQRTKMVQTLEQYIYIHKVLVNAIAFDCEAIPVQNIPKKLDSTSNNVYSRQYQQLRQSVETDNKEDSETRADNERLTNNNRRRADVPGDRFRVLLYLNRECGHSDYINAVYMNSFKKKDYFIIAQSPLPNTVADFVCMIYQEECTCIVTMEDLKEPGMTVGEYLARENHILNLGNFSVACTRLETKHHCIIRKMKIKFSGKYDSGEKTVYHFQYTKWMTGHDTPVNAQEFVQFANEIEEYTSQFGEEKPRVLVHCLKANERSGLFCAVTTLIEKMKYEGRVNVLNTLRHLRTRRRTAITSMEQLKFCYQAMSVYSEIFRS